MTVLVPGKKSFYIGTQATLLNDNIDVADHWAQQHVIHNPAIKWVVGKYVEADNANYNGQYWKLQDLQMSKPTIVHAPMNINHQPRKIVGTFTAAEIMYPKSEDYAAVQNPYIETLGAFWKFYFPEELSGIQQAFDEGKLFQSMECVAESITCIGEGGCGQTFPYSGPLSAAYCEHIQGGGVRQLNNPHFTAGALIIPPASPGWGQAAVQELSRLMRDNAELVDRTYKQVSETMPHLDASDWELMMIELLVRSGSLPDSALLSASAKTLDSLNLTPSDGMVTEAKRGLAWRKEFGRGGTAVGIARARDISNRKTLSPDVVIRMNSFFSRHEVDKKGAGFSPGEDGFPSNGRIAWALWGGDAGQSWARKMAKQIQQIRNPSKAQELPEEDGLNSRQSAQYEALESIAEFFGKFDQGTGPDGSHYVPSSPFEDEGLVCSNCVYFEGGRGCEVVQGEIDPNGICKLWIIPGRLIESAVSLTDSSKMYDSEQRQKMSKEGKALPDGSYPIANVEDLKNAIQAFGRAKDKNAAKRHIIKRARALNAESLIPDGWQ